MKYTIEQMESEFKRGRLCERKELIEEFLGWLENDLGRCSICDTHDKAIKKKIKELKLRRKSK